jgi:ATP-dependent Clp endopeptidase proteolytic subunit ClpP
VSREDITLLVGYSFMAKHSLSIDRSDGFDRFESDLNSQLLRSRTLMVGPNLDETNYNLVIAQLLFLQEQDSDQEISLWINSDHPSEVSALAICDMIGSLSCDVRTYCVGKAVGVSTVLLASGKKGKRTASRSSSICLCHGPRRAVTLRKSAESNGASNLLVIAPPRSSRKSHPARKPNY